ncbi:MAG: coproporphyrinogen-III oxidase family protein [Actinobacteria bacterium]|nr:coproporphyrinogen-III oxidase family protein [Actinomycetota bacterium]
MTAVAYAGALRAFEGPVRHLYVHVPFCRAKCDYCDFASEPVGDAPDGALLDGFVTGVTAEWERERAAHDVRRLHTLYLGGGTPSLLGPDRLERLLELFRPFLTPAAEMTVEANPEDVDEAFAAWAAAVSLARGRAAARGLRVSLGAQSFDPDLRRALGRRAQADPAEAFLRLRAAGAANLSVDLIHGIPGQTMAALDADLAAVLELAPEHISWYELTLAPGTPLARRAQGSAPGDDGAGQADGAAVAGAASDSTAGAADTTDGTTGGTTGGTTRGAAAPDDYDDPTDDARADFYECVVQTLSQAGYGWYEVSSFALPGRKACHNLAYWRARPYLGLGPGAVSTVGARRWTNSADCAAWAAALAAGARPPREVEDLDAATRARERLLLAARCGDPVPLPELAAILDRDAAGPLAAAGLVSLHSGTIRVTRKGRHVAGAVCVRLFRD